MLAPTRSRQPYAAIAFFLLTIVAFLGADTRASANFVGLGQDPAGDAADPDPGRDIVKVGLSYDRRTGHLRGGVKLRGTPTGEAPANLILFGGRRTATGCNGYPAIGFATQTDLTGADWVLLRSPAADPIGGRAEKLYEAEAEEYEAKSRPLAGKRPDCVIAQLNEPGNSQVIYDVAGPYRLRGLPELEARLGKLPAKMRPGRPRTIRVTLRNPGDAPTGKVRLAVARSRGMKMRMPRRIGSLRAGAVRRVQIRVTLSRRARTSTNLRLTARTKQGLRARDRGRLYLVKRRSKPGKGGSSDGGTGSRLCYRYTWLPPYSTLVPC